MEWVSEWVSYLLGKVENIMYGCLDVEWLTPFFIATGSHWKFHPANGLLNVGVRSRVCLHSYHTMWWIASTWQRTCNHRLVAFLLCTGNCGFLSSNPLSFDRVLIYNHFWRKPYVNTALFSEWASEWATFLERREHLYMDTSMLSTLLL